MAAELRSFKERRFETAVLLGRRFQIATPWFPKKQTDLTDHGTFFSLVVIYLMNLLLLSVMLALASAEITFADLGRDFGDNAEKFARWISSLWRQS